jgi:AMMECR1 domain-containing protein
LSLNGRSGLEVMSELINSIKMLPQVSLEQRYEEALLGF